jgi:orotate phosphoribosyltransferase
MPIIGFMDYIIVRSVGLFHPIMIAAVGTAPAAMPDLLATVFRHSLSSITYNRIALCCWRFHHLARELTISQSSSEEILRSVGALHTGHFLLTSGLHSDQYVQGQRLLQYPRYASILAERVAEQIFQAGLKPTVVIGPALGAIHWEVFLGTALDKLSDEPIRAMFAERAGEAGQDPNSFVLRRGMELQDTDQVIVVEDVCTTGGSAKKVVELVRALGSNPIAVGSIVDRSGGTIDFGLQFFKLVTLSLATYAEADCPMCKAGTKPVKPGSSKK